MLIKRISIDSLDTPALIGRLSNIMVLSSNSSSDDGGSASLLARAHLSNATKLAFANGLLARVMSIETENVFDSRSVCLAQWRVNECPSQRAACERRANR